MQVLGTALGYMSGPDGAVCACGAKILNNHCTNYYWARGEELARLLEADRKYLEAQRTVLKRDTWYKVKPGDVSEDCSLCGAATAIVHEEEVEGLPKALTCYCEKCSPVVLM